MAHHQAEALEDEEVQGNLEDELSDEEDEMKTNARDVGHNIYILAHQVRDDFEFHFIFKISSRIMYRGTD